MADPDDSRRRMVMLVVLGVLALGLVTMLVIGLLLGDDTEAEIEQQQDSAGSLRLPPATAA